MLWLRFTEYEIITLTGLALARLLPFRIFSIIPVLYAFVSRPRVRSNPIDLRNYVILAIIFIFQNSLIVYLWCVIFELRCALRYIFLTPLVPLYFFQGKGRRSITPDTLMNPQSIVIRTLWDPPIMLTSYILFKCFGIRLLHDGHNNFVSYVTERLLISSFPFKEDVQRLYTTYKVRSVVNMCSEYAGPVHEYTKHRMVHLRLPTIDGTVPRLADVIKGVEFIEERLASKDPAGGESTVLVHCKGGRGRAASLIICYLLKSKRATSVKEAFDYLKEKRPVLEESILTYHQIYDHFLQKAN